MTNNLNESFSKCMSSSAVIDKKANPRDLLDQNANAIIAKLVECAIAGDLAALRLCVERIIPRSKPDNGITFELPEGRIDSGDNILHITNNVTKAVANGEMTIDEAEKFTKFLKHQRFHIDVAERKKSDEEWKKNRSW